jgi:hypothetical protein
VVGDQHDRCIEGASRNRLFIGIVQCNDYHRDMN